MKTKCVIFDFENTLAKLSVDWKDSFLKVADSYIKNGVPSEVIDPYKYKPIYLINEVYEKMLRLFPREKAERIQKEASKIMEKLELEGVESSELIHNSRETLKMLRDLGIKIGIVTSTSKLSVIKTLEKFGLMDYVDAIFSRDSLGRPKPSPDLVLTCLEALKCDPEHAFMVGDDLKDIQAARNAGVYSIGYLAKRDRIWKKMVTGEQITMMKNAMRETADRIITDLSEIPRIVCEKERL